MVLNPGSSSYTGLTSVPACSLHPAGIDQTAATSRKSATVWAASDAVLAYGMRAAIADRPEAIRELGAALDRVYARTFPGRFVFEQLNGNPTSIAQLDETVVNLIRALFTEQHIEPRDFWMMGLRFFERVNQSNFTRLLTPLLARWQRAGWKRIATAESFRLCRPQQTVPAIEVVLSMPTDDRRFLATLLLA